MKDVYGMSKLESLTKQRRAHVESCKANNDNSHGIIAGMYSSRAHCIYELLQNADDAEASEAIFTLSSDALEFRHNGKKLFSWDDVNAITTVGASPKEDDINAIGKFGAGFKSVFSVTNTPVIRSGGYHFRIVDFIVPEEIENGHGEKDTVINLPFNCINAPKKETYNQLVDGLESLESESLLFLRNMKTIQWQTKSTEGHYSVESGKSEERILVSVVDGEEERKNYLLFSESVDIDNVPLKLSVAYRMSDDKKMIVATEDAKLFVYFPTTLRPMLNFLVHAPYKTTPNRETIPLKDDQQNNNITSALTELIAESIRSIKNMGLLNVPFLSLLPIDENNTHPIYAAAFEKIKNILLNEALLPTVKKGEYTVVENALLALRKDLTNLLDAGDCMRLFAKKCWIDTEITHDKTPELWDYLITHMSVPKISMEKFCQQIDECFIKTKTDKWVANFYANIADNGALYQGKTTYQYKGILREKPILRLEDGTHVCPENEHGELQVYLPTDRKSEFKTVKKSIMSDERASIFLQKLGIVKPDDVAEIREFIVARYRGDDVVDEKQYMRNFKKVRDIWSRLNDSNKETEIIDTLSEINFIGCIDQEKKLHLRKPAYVYDNTEKLQMWFHENHEDEICFVADFLKEKNNWDFISKFMICSEPRTWGTELYGGYGAKDPERSHSVYVKGLNGFNPKFAIEGLMVVLSKITLERSHYIFNLALKHVTKLFGVVHECSRQGFDGGWHNVQKPEFSDAGKLLTENYWLYDKNGCLIEKPLAEIAMDDLHEGYSKDHGNIDKFIKSLGLKIDRIKKFEEETGYKCIPPEEISEYEEWKAEKKRKVESESDGWEASVSAKDANIIVEQFVNALYEQRDSPDQNLHEVNDNDSPSSGSNGGAIDHPNQNPATEHDRRAIGDWGEEYAYQYLVREHPNADIVCLNQPGNTGKGCDFVVRESGKEIYCEVKSKTDDKPTLFITGTQWNLAKQLHAKGKGQMYRILLISKCG